MKRILLIFCLTFFIGTLTYAQDDATVISIAQDNAATVISIPNQPENTHRVYAELLGHGTNFLGANKNVKVTLDFGQYQAAWKSYTIQDEENRDIKFNSMVAAMNYMGERGWKFIQAYVVTVSNQNVYHWLMYKDLAPGENMMDGLNIKNAN